LTLLLQVKEVVREMKEGRPERITWTTIGSKLGISGWLSKKERETTISKGIYRLSSNKSGRIPNKKNKMGY